MSALELSPAEYLAPPVSPPVLRVIETSGDEAEAIARGEDAIEAHEYDGALEAVRGIASTARPELAFRALLVESRARMSLGELVAATALAQRAVALAVTDLDRAEALFRLGCCRLKASDVSAATAELTIALDLADRSVVPCDRLRAQILEWRCRSHQRRRDWDAAKIDAERGLELAQELGDERILARGYVQASLVAERQRQWLVARLYAEEALELCERTGDLRDAHKVLNNLGGIHFLLGDVDRAVACSKDAFRIALELGDDVGAAYATSSLAQIQVRSGDAAQGELHARRAIDSLATRTDHRMELGNAQLVLGHALLAQDKLDDAQRALEAASTTFAGVGSVSAGAAVCVAQGDLAARRGDVDVAAERYRTAADQLQDFNF